MDREEIIKTIRASARKEGVVWLTERGAIVFAPYGDAVCIKGVGREYFKKDCPLLFIEGVVGICVMGTSSDESIGSSTLDEQLHEWFWSELDKPQKAPLEESDTRPPLEKLAELFAPTKAMTPEQKKTFREENSARIDELLFQIALQDEARRMCGEKVH
jgi:hypothetical protein